MPSICASKPLDIQTIYVGKNQVTHPSIVAFKTPWNGYRYWMAYTPFPYMDGAQENPCIAVSNDLIHWDKPNGLINPVATCYEDNCDELKDPELVFNASTQLLELWYLGRINSSLQEGGPLHVFRKTSSDGIHWSLREVLYTYTDKRLVSPAILFDAELNVHRFWGIFHEKGCIALYYMESFDNGYTWSEQQLCEVPKCKETGMWHGGICRADEKLFFVWMGEGQKRTLGQDIYVAESTDGIHFSTVRSIVSNKKGWQQFYRPSLVYTAGKFWLFYGLVRCDNSWHIGLSNGATLDQLEPVETGIYEPCPLSMKVNSFFSYVGKNFFIKGTLMSALLPILLLFNVPLWLSFTLCVLLTFVMLRFLNVWKWLDKAFVTSTLSCAFLYFSISLLKSIISLFINL